jgi:hypothetical protein
VPPPLHFAAPFPLFLEDRPAGSAPRLTQLVSGALEELVLASATEYIRNRPDLRTDYYIGESCFGDGGFKLSSFGHDLSRSVIHPSD